MGTELNNDSLDIIPKEFTKLYGNCGGKENTIPGAEIKIKYRYNPKVVPTSNPANNTFPKTGK